MLAQLRLIIGQTEKASFGKQQEKTVFAAVLSLLSIVGLVFTLHFTSVATRAATEQTKISQREFEASERPWLSLRLSADVLEVGKNQVMLDTSAFIENHGHAVAENVFLWQTVVPSAMESGHECDPSVHMSSDKPLGQLVFPDEKYQLGSPAFGDAVKIGLRLSHPLDPSLPRMLSFDLVSCVFYRSPSDQLVRYTQVRYQLESTQKNNAVFDLDGKMKSAHDSFG